MITLLLIGSGAREHALAKAILPAVTSKNPKVKMHCFASGPNPGIEKLCESYTIGTIDKPAYSPRVAAALAGKLGADLAVIGPEGPLAAGVSDTLAQQGVGVIGPGKALACLESSKLFARNLVADIHPEAVPRFFPITSSREASRILAHLGEDYVIKADGLKGGKGVKVGGEHLHSIDEALAHCRELLTTEGLCLIEEKLDGEEFSVLSFTDGLSCVHMPPLQDHKRAFDGDTGPNTGGMGSYTGFGGTLPFLSDDDIDKACCINEHVVEALLKKRPNPGKKSYCGIIYGGFMACRRGVKVIEYNARFGDPEVINLLALLETDIIDIFLAMINKKLGQIPVRFSKKASVCKYVVPPGYPDKSLSGEPINFSKLKNHNNLFLGSVNTADFDSKGAGDKTEWNLATGASRTAAVVALGDTIADAAEEADTMINMIEGNIFFRKDIGTKELLAKRTAHMTKLREK